MIPATCTHGHKSSASANAHAVVTVTTQAGTVHRVEAQCDVCGSPTSALVDEREAQAVAWVLSARTQIRRLRHVYLRTRRN